MLTLMDDLTGEHADCFFELLSFVATEFKRVRFFFFFSTLTMCMVQICVQGFGLELAVD